MEWHGAQLYFIPAEHRRNSVSYTHLMRQIGIIQCMLTQSCLHVCFHCQSQNAGIKACLLYTSFSSYNKDILSHIDCLEARAVINFLDNWDIESALSNPIVQDALPYDLGK